MNPQLSAMKPRSAAQKIRRGVNNLDELGVIQTMDGFIWFVPESVRTN